MFQDIVVNEKDFLVFPVRKALCDIVFKKLFFENFLQCILIKSNRAPSHNYPQVHFPPPHTPIPVIIIFHF